MNKVQREIYNNFMKFAKENGYKVIPGRKLTEDEKRGIEQHHQEVYDFSKQSREFEKESRKRKIVAKQERDLDSMIA